MKHIFEWHHSFLLPPEEPTPAWYRHLQWLKMTGTPWIQPICMYQKGLTRKQIMERFEVPEGFDWDAFPRLKHYTTRLVLEDRYD